MAKQKTDPGLPTLEDVLGDAEAYLQLEVPDFAAAHVRIAKGIEDARAATEAETGRRGVSLERFDAGSVARSDARLATLRQVLPDLEKARDILHQREAHYLTERARVDLPSLLKALPPLAAALKETLQAEITERAALKAGANRVNEAISRIPVFEMPSFTAGDYAIADEVDRLLKSEVVGEEILRVGPPNVRVFSLPNAPRDLGPVTVVTMQRRGEPQTFDARERGEVG